MGKVEERNFPGNKYLGLFYSNEEYDKQQQVHQDHRYCDKYLGLMPWQLNHVFVQMKTTMSGTKTTDPSAAPQLRDSHPIQQEVSLFKMTGGWMGKD